MVISEASYQSSISRTDRYFQTEKIKWKWLHENAELKKSEGLVPDQLSDKIKLFRILPDTGASKPISLSAG